MPELRKMNDIILRPVENTVAAMEEGFLVEHEGKAYFLVFNRPGTALRPGDILFQQARPEPAPQIDLDGDPVPEL